jgi:hypothetical protein
MPGPRNRTGTDPSLNHPLTMSYMGAGSGWEKRPGRCDFHPPLQGRVAPRRDAGWGNRDAAQPGLSKTKSGSKISAAHRPPGQF